MFLKIVVLFFVLAGGFVYGSIFTSNDKICDTSKVTSFSGFKIHRSYVVKHLKPPMLHFVSLTHCHSGKMDYERLTRTGRETDIDWKSPICFITDENFRNGYGKHGKHGRGDRSRGFKSLNDAPKKSHSFQPESINLGNKFDKRSSHSQTFYEFLKKFSSHTSFIEYNEDPLAKNLEDLNTFTYKNVTVEDLNKLKCYKLARRKKYATREMMLYAPYTWVGGIFECDISKYDKTKYLESLKDSRDFINSFKFQCNKENSIPLFPLIADDITGQWVEKERGFTISQRIPYLYSPGVFDLRYGKAAQKLGLNGDGVIYKDHVSKGSIDKLPFDDWYKKIDVNENYSYSQDDIGKITEAVTKSANLFNEFLSINSKYLPWEWDKTELIGQDKSSLSYLEHKVSTIISRVANRTSSLKFMTKVQQKWDELTL